MFHAGTKIDGTKIVTNGGRILCVVSSAETAQEAQNTAYERVNEICWDKVYYRDDIGYRAINREKAK